MWCLINESRTSYGISYTSRILVRMLPSAGVPRSVRLQRGSNHSIKPKHPRSLRVTITLSCSNLNSGWSGLSIHTLHNKAKHINCTPLPLPVLNSFVIAAIIPCWGACPSRADASRYHSINLHLRKATHSSFGSQPSLTWWNPYSQPQTNMSEAEPRRHLWDFP